MSSHGRFPRGKRGSLRPVGELAKSSGLNVRVWMSEDQLMLRTRPVIGVVAADGALTLFGRCGLKKKKKMLISEEVSSQK